MVAAAIAGNPAFEASRIELDRPGPSYTVDTLEALALSDPDLVLILSSEAYAGLPTWRDPSRVLELARLAIAPRDGYPDAGPELVARLYPGMEDRVVVLDGPRIRLSASDLRTRAAAGRSLRYLVPDAVAAYIGDHGLYRTTRRDDRS
jgi:nicotinate-nucleotide adenylyltransferase